MKEITEDKALEEYLCVKESTIHGKGLFACDFINAGSYLGTYSGTETQENDIYVLWVEDEQGQWGGRDGNNILRFLNHAAVPNAELDGYDVYSLQDIQIGEEIFFHYGEEFEASLESGV